MLAKYFYLPPAIPPLAIDYTVIELARGADVAIIALKARKN